MSWRTVVITQHAKLDYKNKYLIIRYDEVNMVHISEINTLLIETTMANITSSLLCELIKNKIKVIFCDEKHNPLSELVAYYGGYNTSKKVLSQISWDEYYKKMIWTQIIKQKILNQAFLLHREGLGSSDLLYQYAEDIQMFDSTNREGHAAKVYFNCLFGKEFSRDLASDINAALDYGYTILLSNFNREIVANGYITQLGIKHINEYNQFNLTSDLMEPFRIVVDRFVYENIDKEFNRDFKHALINLLNLQVKYDGKQYYLTNAIQIYVKKVFQAIEHQSLAELSLFQYP